MNLILKMILNACERWGGTVGETESVEAPNLGDNRPRRFTFGLKDYFDLVKELVEFLAACCLKSRLAPVKGWHPFHGCTLIQCSRAEKNSRGSVWCNCSARLHGAHP